MVKKLITAGVAAATLLALAGGAWAGHHRHDGGTRYEGSVENNNVVAVANTGVNFQRGGGDQEMETGDATALATQENYVNIDTCGCRRHGETRYDGDVEDNNVVAVANTGLNFQLGGKKHHRGGDLGVDSYGGDGGHHSRGGDEQEMETGDAYADAWQVNYVNSSVAE